MVRALEAKALGLIPGDYHVFFLFQLAYYNVNRMKELCMILSFS